MSLGLRGARILDLDIENRPLSYWIPDRPTAEITAIAWKFSTGKPYGMRCYTLHPDFPDSYELMLDRFVEAYDQADMVTGHYILRHDLPIINGALLEMNRAPLGEKLVSDTKIHLLKKADISASQQDLAAMIGVHAPKVQMTQADWREANRLTDAGIAKTRKRVTGDVRQHIEMRNRLLELGWLGPPTMWRP